MVRTDWGSKGKSHEGQESDESELHVCGLVVRDLGRVERDKGRPATEVYKKR